MAKNKKTVKRKGTARKNLSRKGNGGASWMKRGKDVTKESERLKAEAEQKAEQRKRTGGIDPNKMRYWLPRGEAGDIVILDEDLDTVAFYEHNLKKDGKYGHYESCPGEWENCPLCAAGDRKYFVWFLTILDCRGYTKDDGTEVPYTRRLLPIKQSQATAFKRVLQAAMKKHGTTRGVVLTIERDDIEKSAAIGEPVINDEGQMFNFLDEDALIDEYGHKAIKNKQGEVIVPKNGSLEPLDYDALFPKPSAKEIAKRWGLAPQAGSDEEYEDEDYEDEDYEDDDDELESDESESDDSDEDWDDDEEWDEDDEEEEEEEPEPPKRKKSKKRSVSRK